MESTLEKKKETPWLFSKPFEIIYLVVPMLFMPIIFYEIFYKPNWGDSDILWTRFVVNTFLFSYLHVILTFTLILSSPVLRSWIQENYKTSVNLWLLKIFGILTLFIIFFWAGGAHFTVKSEWRQFFCFLFIFVGSIAPHFHSIWQIRGISTLYDEGKTAYFERLLITLLFFIFAFTQTVRFTIDFPASLTLFTPFVKSVHKFPLEALRKIGFTLGLIISSAIFIYSLTRKGKYKNTRSLFLLRLFLFPLGAYSFFALAASSAAHGLEYLAVFWKVSDAHPADQRKKIRKYGIISMLFILPFLMPIYLVFWFNSIFKPHFFLEFLSALGIALVYTHYIVDGALYRMKNPITRKIVGPMLSND